MSDPLEALETPPESPWRAKFNQFVTERQPTVQLQEVLFLLIKTIERSGADIALLLTSAGRFERPANVGSYRLEQLFVPDSHAEKVPEWLKELDMQLAGRAGMFTFADVFAIAEFFVAIGVDILATPFIEHMYAMLRLMGPAERALCLKLSPEWLSTTSAPPPLPPAPAAPNSTTSSGAAEKEGATNVTTTLLQVQSELTKREFQFVK
jgi:hypothetical protein